jgi:tetratricopeptide (TPR) repeat protein
MGRLGDATRKIVGAPLRALMPKSPWLRWLIVLIVVLLLLAVLEPALSLLSRGAGALVHLLTPMLDNPLGRLLLLNGLLIAAAVIGWYVVRGRWRALRSGLVLRRHLDAVGALVQSQPRRARELFRRVATARSAPPAEFPAAREDARLKLARLALEAGDANEALAWLARIRDKGLPKELARSVVQLRAEAYLMQRDVLPETVEQDLRASLELFPDDRRVLALLRHVVVERGELEEAAKLQERIVKHTTARERDADVQQLVGDLVRAGEVALARNDLGRARALARKARGVDGAAPEPLCLLGKVRAADGDLRGALREWGGVRAPEGLGLIADVLARHPGAIGPREILEACPTEGGLLLVAREYARAGEHRKALRAARRAARHLGPTPTVAALLAEVLALCGKHDEARQLCEDAVLRLVAPAR